MCAPVRSIYHLSCICKKIDLKSLVVQLCINDINYLLEEFIEHDFVDLTRSRAVQLRYLIRLGQVTVEGPELTARIPEEDKKVFGFRACNLLEHFLFGLPIDGARKHTVFNGI